VNKGIILPVFYEDARDTDKAAIDILSKVFPERKIVTVDGMKLIKAYNMGSDSFKKYKGAIDEQQSLWKKVAHKMGPLYAIFVIILQCGVAVIIPAGGIMYNHGQIGAGGLMLFAFVGSLYLSELRPLMELGSSFSKVLN